MAVALLSASHQQHEQNLPKCYLKIHHFRSKSTMNRYWIDFLSINSLAGGPVLFLNTLPFLDGRLLSVYCLVFVLQVVTSQFIQQAIVCLLAMSFNQPLAKVLTIQSCKLV